MATDREKILKEIDKVRDSIIKRLGTTEPALCLIDDILMRIQNIPAAEEVEWWFVYRNNTPMLIYSLDEENSARSFVSDTKDCTVVKVAIRRLEDKA